MRQEIEAEQRQPESSVRQPDGPGPRNATSLVDTVHKSMREGILSGHYRPGSRLLANAIAGENGVSPIPVREAIRRLEAERLVVIETNRGATVAPISVHDLADVYDTRRVVEAHALRTGAPAVTPAVITVAEHALERMTRELTRGDDRSAYRHHRSFHFALYECAGSPWTMHLIEQLWTGAERYLRLSPGMRSTAEEFAAEHRAILDAVRGGEVEAAVELLDLHLRRTAALLAGGQ